MRGPETERSHQRRCQEGFYTKFMKGSGLDIGYKGSLGLSADPVLSTAIGVDLGYPGYNGLVLPFKNETQDYVFASHVLEHLDNPIASLKDWFRVLKLNGHLVIMVPHKYLYEKRLCPPSKWNADHKAFYTPNKLLHLIDLAFEVNTWRLRHCEDNDRGFDYSIGPERHSNGAYEIECVIQKIQKPNWDLA